MKPRILICLSLLLFLFSCTSKEDIATITRAENLLDISPDSALQVLHQIKNSTSLSKYYKMKYSLINVLGKYKAYQDVKQDTFIFKVADYFNKRRNQNDKALANYAAASVLNERGNYIDAMVYYKNAEKVLENSDNYLMKGLIDYNVAELYDKELTFGKAVFHFKRASQEFSKLNDSQIRQMNSLIFLGSEYMVLEELNNALESYQKAYKLSIEINNLQGQAMTLNNIGLVYQKKKDFYKAISYFNQSVKLNVSNDEQKYQVMLNLSNSYLKTNKLHLATTYVDELQKSIDSLSNLSYIVSVTIFLKDYYRKIDNYKEAFYYLDKNHQFLYKLFDENQSKALLEADKKFDYTYESNKRLEAENKNAIFRRTVVILALVILIFILLFFLYRTRTKNILLKNENEKKILQSEHQQKIWSEYFYSYIASANKEIMNTIYKLSINSLIKDNEKLSTLLDQTNKEFQSNLLNQQKKLLNTNSFYEITGVDKEQAALLNDNEKMLLSLLCCQLSREQISVMLNTTTESVRVRTIKLTQKLAEKAIKSNYNTKD